MKPLLALCLFASVAAADPSPLAEWTFDRDTQGWVTIPGTVTTTLWDRNPGALRWEYDKSEKGKTFGVQVGGLKIASSGPVFLHFRIRSEGTKFLLFAAKEEGGQTWFGKVPLALEGWQDLTCSTECMIGGKGFSDPAKFRELLLWDEAGGGDAGHVTMRLDSLRVEATAPAPVAVEMPAAVEPHPRLAVHLSYAALQDPKQIAVELGEAKRLGIGMVELIGSEWTDFETAPGKWDWSKLDALTKEAAAREMKLVACAGGIINLKYDWKVHVPSDVAFDGDFTKLLPRYGAYLDRFFARYGKQVKVFTFHSERCGVYFAKNPGQLDSYEKFLRAAVERVKKLCPGVQTGVCLVHDEDPVILRRLCRVGDVSTFLFDVSEHPSWLADRYAALLDAAGDRKIAFNEAFHASSPYIGSSEADQALYVKELFAQMSKHADRLEWCTWWCIRDDDPAIWTTFGEYLAGGKNGAAIGMRELYSCGLLRRDGTAKPAAAAWVEGVLSLPRN